MAIFNTDKFAAHLKLIALADYGKRRCAKHVRLALEHAGAITTGHPMDAKDWGPTLSRIGFRKIEVANADLFHPQIGDVIVIQATSTSSSGHIQGYDGKQWISDFRQGGFCPGPLYRKEKPHVDAYRP